MPKPYRILLALMVIPYIHELVAGNPDAWLATLFLALLGLVYFGMNILGFDRAQSEADQKMAKAFGYELLNMPTSSIIPIVTYLPERTCKNIGEPKGSFLCSECEWGDFAPRGLPLKNAKCCPNCGAKVVE